MERNSNIESIESLDLNPPPGKVYTNISRPFEEDVIYFLLIDRFHDGKDRSIVYSDGRIKGYGTKHQLRNFYGGNIEGVIKELDYIVSLGCTAIWLSPIFENNPTSYHGYAIQNFLNVDPRFGTKADFIRLIQSAHDKGLKVFLDCVTNHSGNNWNYKAENGPAYNGGKQFEFGQWIQNVYPLELRNEKYYQRKGHIENWDKYPESREGDFFSLKKFNHSESKEGLELQDILFKIYSNWIKETDCDGFRMDAGKHLGALPLARFSTRIKQYAKSIGKDDFIVFSEITGDDKVLTSFCTPVRSDFEDRSYEPTDSCLDFPLHFILPKVVRGDLSPTIIYKRFKSIAGNLSFKFPLITFLDNHDQIESPFKERIAAACNDKQLLGALGLLFTLPGIPCIYYGTEQGFRGFGEEDICIREGMFSKDDNTCAHNKESTIYKQIAELLKIKRDHKVLSYGSLEEVPCIQGTDSDVVFFCRVLQDDKIFVAYNPEQEHSQIIELPQKAGVSSISILFDREGKSENFQMGGKAKASLTLQPLEFIIFRVD